MADAGELTITLNVDTTLLEQQVLDLKTLSDMFAQMAGKPEDPKMRALVDEYYRRRREVAANDETLLNEGEGLHL